MATRERCYGCGTQLQVPPQAQTIQCYVCNSITRVQTADYPLIQANHYSINNAANQQFNTLTNPVSQNIPRKSYSFPGAPSYGYGYGYGYYPPPPRPAPFMMPAPSLYGNRRAVLCGISYVGTDIFPLKGIRNNITYMKSLLVEKMGFPNQSILVLTDYDNDPTIMKPTKQNIMWALQNWLVGGCQPGDSLVFYYTGHGSKQQDLDMDEVDGFDEMVCPVDYKIPGRNILDDEINATIVRPLPPGTTLHAFMDTCHSGTVLDLPFVCKMKKDGSYAWEDHRRPGIYKGTNGGLAVCISACDDHQVAAENTVLSGGHTLMGVMTCSFIRAVQNEPVLTYGSLLRGMKSAIREAKNGIRLQFGPFNSIFMAPVHISQKPHISSSMAFDIYMKQFVL